MSKRIWKHPAERATGRNYWRSFGELDDTPEFREWIDREFPQGAALMKDEADAGQSRRDFMKLMGAATTLAGFGLASCRRPEARILPYSKKCRVGYPGQGAFLCDGDAAARRVHAAGGDDARRPADASPGERPAPGEQRIDRRVCAGLGARSLRPGSFERVSQGWATRRHATSF